MYLLGKLLGRLIRTGTLVVVDATGRRHSYGAGAPEVVIRLHSRLLPYRLFLHPRLAVGEAYMEGTLTIETGDVYDLLDLAVRNAGWATTAHWAQGLLLRAQWLARRIHQYNPIGKAQANVAHHYDLSDTLYDLFLDADRQYSCAYFIRPDDTLERAQAQKKRHIAAKLLLRPGQKILDIGCGWGGLALYLAKIADAEVTGVTLSKEQHQVARRRAAEAGLAGRVDFKLLDYRLESGRFDRIVSVGMFEHVGVGHYDEFFGALRQLLADDGVALLHTIGRADGPGETNTWIRKYIFPGGYSPALSEVLPAIERAGLYVTDVEVLRLHYAETLRHWRQRVLANRERIVALYDERFLRMWEFYLAGSEVTFRHAGHVVFQIQLAKRVDAVPLTRDYIADYERAHPLLEAVARPRASSAAE
jgi:cyclopropane-fatty-acyl-phospholipid synthase